MNAWASTPHAAHGTQAESAAVRSARGRADVPGASATPADWFGVRQGADGARFRVFAHADAMQVRLGHPGTRESVTLPMRQELNQPDVWHAEAPGDRRGWTYVFDLERDGVTLGGIVDPWARLVRHGVGYIVRDESVVKPRPAMQPRDAVIYEVHVRDFTHDANCGVRHDWRGRYLGMAQSGTRLAGTSFATGLDHLLELGVNVVQLMPVHSFAMPYHADYEWGYMPLDFNAPHAGYASGVDAEAPVRELKRLISTLHERGVRVTLDVVYNHTAERWPDRLHSLMALAPREYFRFRDDGAPWDGSKCGNEFRSESPMGRRFIVDSCLMWVNEYGVDGFRFDLMGLIDVQTMIEVRAALHAVDPTLLIYGEPWVAGPTPIEVNGKGAQRSRGWAVFNDQFRDGFRGEVFNPADRGFLQAGTGIDRVKGAIVGGVRAFTDSPLESINYIECHDNHTLADRLRLTAPEGTGEEDRERMHRLGALALLTSQGIPFIHSGQELGRTKEGHDNTYNMGDHVNNIRWKDKAERYRLFALYRDLIAIRREHEMFRLTTREEVESAVKFIDDDLGMPLPGGTIGYVLTDPTGRDKWARAAVLMNGSSREAVMPLPDGRWRVPMALRRSGDVRDEHAGTVTLPPHCGALLYQARGE